MEGGAGTLHRAAATQAQSAGGQGDDALRHRRTPELRGAGKRRQRLPPLFRRRYVGGRDGCAQDAGQRTRFTPAGARHEEHSTQPAHAEPPDQDQPARKLWRPIRRQRRPDVVQRLRVRLQPPSADGRQPQRRDRHRIVRDGKSGGDQCVGLCHTARGLLERGVARLATVHQQRHRDLPSAQLDNHAGHSGARLSGLAGCGQDSKR